jgi:hypothetical protein
MDIICGYVPDSRPYLLPWDILSPQMWL